MAPTSRSRWVLLAIAIGLLAGLTPALSAQAQAIPRPVYGLYFLRLADTNADWPDLQPGRSIVGNGAAAMVGGESSAGRYSGSLGFAAVDTASFFQFSMAYDLYLLGGFVRPYGGLGFSYLSYAFEEPAYSFATPGAAFTMGMNYLLNDQQAIDIRLTHTRTATNFAAYELPEGELTGSNILMLRSSTLMQIGFIVRRRFY
ncbi:MAG: hypothetical protein K0U36_06730 [Alphaproteobacteria bacterium]|nr:hypothetical protein [Alphaproteobacteria bacterium]